MWNPTLYIENYRNKLTQNAEELPQTASHIIGGCILEYWRLTYQYLDYIDFDFRPIAFDGATLFRDYKNEKEKKANTLKLMSRRLSTRLTCAHLYERR